MFFNEAKKAFGVEAVTSQDMDIAIINWMNTYRGFPAWVDKENGIKSIKFAKAICSETSRLVTLALGIEFDGGTRAKYLQDVTDKMIMPRLRNWVEYGCAAGTIILKPNGAGIDMVTPDRFRVVGKDGNGCISSIVFEDSYQEGTVYYTKLEYHRFMTADVKMPGQEIGKAVTYYMISNRTYKSAREGSIGKECNMQETRWSNLLPEVTITKSNGEKINSMLFGVLKMPSANDIDMDSPLGVSIFSDAMEEIRDLDIAYSRNAGEIYDSNSIELLDDRLLNVSGKKIGTGSDICLPRYVHNVFGDGEKEFYQSIDRPLKTDLRIKGINNQLSFIGYKCGYSNGYFVFDQKSGMITATQVEADDRRTIQLIKDIRDRLQIAVNDLLYALSVFADLYNLSPAGSYEANYSFGDITYNFEEDKMHHYNLAVAGKYPWEEYYVEYLKYSRADAKRLLKMAKEENKEPGLLEDEE